ncbi:MAG: hypothetical protein B7X06_00720 [Verrucomicrobia bacterium 21-51-4]|nr:MAG: hypothetical protein B7X06_00720 [Verrucomicrobia bacterium 21-51-4]HQU08689.1 type II secretion system protein [Opitutales bacterium]
MKLLSRYRITRRTGRGFTLIELLAVIGIIALLAAILVPTLGKALESGRRTKAASHLRQICLAYVAYAHADGCVRTLNANEPHEWAAALARQGGPNEAVLYWVEGDPELPNLPAHPVTVLTHRDGDCVQALEDSINPEFMAIPLSYAMAAQLPPQASASTTPVVWTCGLQADGTWSAESPFEGHGGYIGFLDGHVAWYPNLNGSDGQGALLCYGSSARTKSIQAAVGRAKILERLPLNTNT